jgi:predicted secreted acid phosphatase
MGDNLNDFVEVFDKSQTVADRIAAVERNREQLGTHFTILPNVMYEGGRAPSTAMKTARIRRRPRRERPS